jgi:16S rRNA (cytidine1402-2'-O)-methyltransferase
MCLLSLAGVRLDQFIFRGFLPASRDERDSSLRELVREQKPVIVMDTPYRLEKLVAELAGVMPTRVATLGCDFTSDREVVLQGTLSELVKKWSARPPDARKAEFMILLHGSPGR